MCDRRESCFAELSAPGQTRDPGGCCEAAGRMCTQLTARWPLEVRKVGKSTRAVRTRVGRAHDGRPSSAVECGGEGPEDMPMWHQSETTLQGFFTWNWGWWGTSEVLQTDVEVWSKLCAVQEVHVWSSPGGHLGGCTVSILRAQWWNETMITSPVSWCIRYVCSYDIF